MQQTAQTFREITSTTLILQPLSNSLHCILASSCNGPASTICRQNTQSNEPLGQEALGAWQAYSSHSPTNTHQIRGGHQHATYQTLLRCTAQRDKARALRQCLELQAGNITAYAQTRCLVSKYHRASSSFNSLQALTSGGSNNNQATWHNVTKYIHQGKGKCHKGKSLWRLRELQSQQPQKRKSTVNQLGTARQSTSRTTRVASAARKDKAKEIQRSKRTTRDKRLLHVPAICGHFNLRRHQLRHKNQTGDRYNDRQPANTSAVIGSTQQPAEDNNQVNPMIHFGVTTHVRPPWFATQIPVQQLEQLKFVTNPHVKL